MERRGARGFASRIGESPFPKELAIEIDKTGERGCNRESES